VDVVELVVTVLLELVVIVLLKLALLRHPAELPVELGALREPGRAERVALRDEAARRFTTHLPP
jgi:hypothetical protein